jgi:hypothetical protein
VVIKGAREIKGEMFYEKLFLFDTYDLEVFEKR